MDTAKNITEIKQKIGAAAAKSGRRGGDITIVAATKYAAAGIIKGLPEYGIGAAGENRVQDFLVKYRETTGCGVEWHFIGQLQTNKVKYIIDKVRLIHSVDRLALAAEIQRQCVLKNIESMDVLIEVNTGGGGQKGGVAPDAALAFAESLKAFDRVRVRGLMTVMPVSAGNGEKCRNLYLQMKGLYDILQGKRENIDVLSMGMSDDFVTAVECGATMVRLGRVLFS